MLSLPFILLLLGFICFVLAAFGARIGEVNLVALGLAFSAAALLAHQFTGG